MSKTFKTRPLIVKIYDKNDNSVILTENHDHRNNDCDLPEKKISNINDYSTHCYYSYDLTHKNLCGCALCTEQFERKAERRKTRHNKKKDIKQIINSY